MTAADVRWWCFNCQDTGSTDKAAEKHTRDTGHATGTRVREWVGEGEG